MKARKKRDRLERRRKEWDAQREPAKASSTRPGSLSGRK